MKIVFQMYCHLTYLDNRDSQAKEGHLEFQVQMDPKEIWVTANASVVEGLVSRAHQALPGPLVPLDYLAGRAKLATRAHQASLASQGPLVSLVNGAFQGGRGRRVNPPSHRARARKAN